MDPTRAGRHERPSIPVFMSVFASAARALARLLGSTAARLHSSAPQMRATIHVTSLSHPYPTPIPSLSHPARVPVLSCPIPIPISLRPIPNPIPVPVSHPYPIPVPSLSHPYPIPIPSLSHPYPKYACLATGRPPEEGCPRTVVVDLPRPVLVRGTPLPEALFTISNSIQSWRIYCTLLIARHHTTLPRQPPAHV